jgi:hypothetical protein
MALVCFVQSLVSFIAGNVRMAERFKAPDSRLNTLVQWNFKHSGPQQRAWVQIPLLTCIVYYIGLFSISKSVFSAHPSAEIAQLGER